jgi:uncharacterized protein (DUF2147 family)
MGAVSRAFIQIVLRVAAVTLFILPACGGQGSPAGVWKTIDDRTHQPRGTIRVYEENGRWFGRIETSFNPADRDERCDKCSGERKDQAVIGMVVMRGLAKHGSEYSGGDILDPDTGFVYQCRFTMSADGKKLMVRGFVGISILGRTQIWIREEDKTAARSD